MLHYSFQCFYQIVFHYTSINPENTTGLGGISELPPQLHVKKKKTLFLITYYKLFKYFPNLSKFFSGPGHPSLLENHWFKEKWEQ